MFIFENGRLDGRRSAFGDEGDGDAGLFSDMVGLRDGIAGLELRAAVPSLCDEVGGGGVWF